MPNEQALTVSQLSKYIGALMSYDEVLSNVTVQGEISNFKAHPSGHLYFSLKDSHAKLNCVMFQSSAIRLKFNPGDGMRVIISGYIGVYEKIGSYQLYASYMKEAGGGALYEKYNQLLVSLKEQGYFDEAAKKQIPFLPKRVALVTSPASAAVRDMISVISRRSPSVQIIICPVAVQGEDAADEIASMIERLNQIGIADVIITGRGGGSIEELWAFNEPAVARAISDSRIPVISAVGHETDFTIADFVADLRAPTPSAAGELAVPDSMELKNRIKRYSRSLSDAMRLGIRAYKTRIQIAQKFAYFAHPQMLTANRRKALAEIQGFLQREARNKTDLSGVKLENYRALLNSLSYENVLRRGYSLLVKDGAVCSASMINKNDAVTVITSEYEFGAVVNQKNARQDHAENI